jgi:hypothetical protein
MTRVRTFAIALAAAQLCGCTTLATQNDDMCAAFRAFAESVPSSGRHFVTLRTDWGAEPTKACERVEAPPELALCAYLMENSSWEFMGFNIRRALQCLKVGFPPNPDQLYVESLVGSVRSHRPAFTDRNVDVELDFDSTSRDGLPHLTIAVIPEVEE